MRNFQREVQIDAPPERVWAIMRDFVRWPEWTPSVISIRQLGSGPLVPGARLLVKQPKFPPAVFRLTEIEEGRHFTWVSAAPGFTVIARHFVTPSGAGTLATLSLEMTGILGGLWGRWTRGITERYLDMEAGGLKKRSETL